MKRLAVGASRGGGDGGGGGIKCKSDFYVVYYLKHVLLHKATFFVMDLTWQL